MLIKQYGLEKEAYDYQVATTCTSSHFPAF